MASDSIRLVILALSYLSWHFCLAELSPPTLAITFFELPYHATKDDQDRTRSVKAVFEKEGCQPIQMDNGIRSIMPEYGMICEIFSQPECKGTAWSNLVWPGPNDLSLNTVGESKDEMWGDLDRFSYRCLFDKYRAYGLIQEAAMDKDAERGNKVLDLSKSMG